jgi:serine phosphatase RsbU (regulator of sigma subunit)
MTNLAVVVVTLGLAIVLMMALSTRRVIRTMSESIIHQTSRRTELKLRTFFGPVSNQVDSLRGWGETGELDIDQVKRLPYIFEELLREFPHSAAVYVADELDREIYVSRRGSSWLRREMNVSERGGVAVITEWSEEDPAPRVREETLEYRASTRPWFQGAVELMNTSVEAETEDYVFWTDPYSFFSTGMPGITAAAAFRSKEGGLQVVGMDVTVAEISRFTSTLRILGEGSVFVLTEDHRLLGVPRDHDRSRTEEEIEQMILKTPEELGTNAARDASEQLLASEASWNRAIRIVTDRAPWWGQVTPYQLSPSQRLLIGVGIPEEDLIEGIQQQRLWVVAITVAVLGAAILRILNLARRYSRPIEDLVDESHRISTGDLEPGPPIQSRVAEVQQLAEAHNEMRLGLKTLMKLEHDLQLARDIQRRTFPDKIPELEGFDIAAWNEPADQTGGDSYDIIGLRDSSDHTGPSLTQDKADRAVLLLADATGHGIGPALSVTQLRAMLRMAVRLSPETSGIIEQINQQVWADLPAERFITAWLGVLDARHHALTAFSAAQAPLLLFRAAGQKFETLGSNSVALGMFPLIKVVVPDPIVMESGDIYAAISDGIFEASGPDGEEMESERVCEIIRHNRNESAAKIIDQIRTATESFTKGAPADDDRTIILIKRT